MPGAIIIGSQWGDEGKGKIVDIIAEDADYIIRFQGGNNAGHTLVVEGDTYTFHALPSGAVRGIRGLIASEVVLDPRQLADEINSFNGDVNLGIDPRTAIIMPWHNDLDYAQEKARSKAEVEIGTTQKGIGPSYSDDINRWGIRFSELVGNPDTLEERMRAVHEEIQEKTLRGVYNMEPRYDIDETVLEYQKFGRDLKKYLADVSKEVDMALKEGKKVIFEGAQGTLLDLKFGNYDRVTSSHPMSGAIFTSVGIPPTTMKNINRIIGITKAYVTKVGSGPVVTCLDKGLWPVEEEKSEYEGNYIREKGHEVGTTTKRPRRVGWMDLIALKYTQRLNGFSELALMKLDVLAGLDKIKLAVAYKHKFGRVLDGDDYPSWDLKFLSECESIYEEFDGIGSEEEIRGVTKYRKLTKNARKFVERVEYLMGVPITIVSTGPGREETIFRKKFKKF